MNATADLNRRRAEVAARRTAAQAQATPPDPPATPEEAEQRYYRRYGWDIIVALLGAEAVDKRPATVDEWVGLAIQTKLWLSQHEPERMAALLERAARELRQRA